MAKSLFRPALLLEMDLLHVSRPAVSSLTYLSAILTLKKNKKPWSQTVSSPVSPVSSPPLSSILLPGHSHPLRLTPPLSPLKSPANKLWSRGCLAIPTLRWSWPNRIFPMAFYHERFQQVSAMKEHDLFVICFSVHFYTDVTVRNQETERWKEGKSFTLEITWNVVFAPCFFKEWSVTK